MRCYNCDCEFDDIDARWAGDDPYCEDCFENQFHYCISCDSVIDREGAYYDDEGDAYCNPCWSRRDEEEYDHECPEDPPVYDSDREFIVQLCRNWLEGKNEYKRLISVNQKDFFLQRIREKTGLLDSPIYLFGLKDREEYQISASPNIIDTVKEFVQDCNLDAIVSEGIGCNRLGVSYTLRNNHQKEIVQLIKHIASEEAVLA